MTIGIIARFRLIATGFGRGAVPASYCDVAWTVDILAAVLNNICGSHG